MKRIILITTLLIIISTIFATGYFWFNEENVKDGNEDVVRFNLYKDSEENYLTKGKIYNILNEVDEEEIVDKDSKKKDNKLDLSNRINVLVLGVEDDPRSDTIIFGSFDYKKKKLDLINIPRDTYYYKRGFDTGDHRKINASYARNREEGVKEAVEKILGVPIHNYVIVKYEGVKKIVDVLGGVEVDVPFDMKHGNSRSKNYINLKKGKQVLNGENSVKFLRYRMDNNRRVGYKDGDIGRIKSQQEFIKSAIKKSISYRLPAIIAVSFKHIKTDMKLKDVLYYGYKAYGLKEENINTYLLPGRQIWKQIYGISWSYYINDKRKTKEMIENILIDKN